MSEAGSSSSTEAGSSGTVRARELGPDEVRRGLRLLAIVALVSLLLALAASAAFATGRFADYPYSWF